MIYKTFKTRTFQNNDKLMLSINNFIISVNYEALLSFTSIYSNLNMKLKGS
jgi:hypothetical protein